MKASLRSVRIAPKKANLVAGMIRGLPVKEAQQSLERTNKKAARILEDLLKSAVANARSNDNQDPEALVIKTLTVNKAQAYHRGVPMARGRVRPMRKFLSHIELTLGIDGIEDEKPAKEEKKTKESASQKPAKSADSAKTSAPKSKSEKSTSASKATKKPAAKKDTSPSDSKSSVSKKSSTS